MTSSITWDEARQYSEIVGMRSADEVEKWEWAARGCINSRGSTMKVGRQEPSPFGLQDMLGNVLQWVARIALEPTIPQHQTDPKRTRFRRQPNRAGRLPDDFDPI